MTAAELTDALRAKLKCAVCDRRVERVSRFSNLVRMEVLFEVQCHGAREVVKVPRELFDADLDFSMTPAFSQPRLAPCAA